MKQYKNLISAWKNKKYGYELNTLEEIIILEPDILLNISNTDVFANAT